MTRDLNPADETTSAKLPAETAGESDIYLYESAGIRERSGHIPAWLKLVAMGLILWGIYYTIRYWSSY